MYQCRTCEGLFDAGELRGGVCVDCIEREQQEEERKEWTRQMLKRSIAEQEDGQLVLCYGKS